MPVKPPASHQDLLERPLFATMATVRPDGAPQLNPMWFEWDAEQGVIRLTHTKVRSNYRALQSERRVALCVVDPDNGYRYLSLRGTITAIDDDPQGDQYKRLQLRYLGRNSDEVPDREVRVRLTVTPEHFRVEES